MHCNAASKASCERGSEEGRVTYRRQLFRALLQACWHHAALLGTLPSPVVGVQVWKYEGCRTLSYYLKRRDCLQVLARDLGVPEKAVVATVMNQIFECLTVIISPAAAFAH